MSNQNNRPTVKQSFFPNALDVNILLFEHANKTLQSTLRKFKDYLYIKQIVPGIGVMLVYNCPDISADIRYGF